MRMMRQFLGGFAAMTLVACNLDLQNPNSPTEGQVTSSPDGVIALATGLQGRFSVSYGNYAYMAGLVTDEFASTTAALISISDAEQGSVPPGTGIAENVFNSIYRTVRTADDLLTGANTLAGQFDAGTRSGLKALAFALKAESLGEALQSYQQIPINTFGVTAPTYVNRATALPFLRSLLDSAEAELAATPPSAFFNSNILTPGMNLPNAVHLLRARYARMAGDDATAITASDLVARSGPTAMSVLTFPAPGVNFYANVTGGTNGINPRRQWRLSMTGGDQRFTWFVVPSTTATGRVGALLDPWNRYANPQSPLPVYFPDEALLIKAEALANTNRLAESQAVLDSVRTDCTGNRGIDDPKACLAPTGLRWEDARRRNHIFGPVAAPGVPNEGQRCWIPYALGDRNANPNVPPDPAEPTSFPSGCTY